MKLIVKWADNKPPFVGLLLEGEETSISYDYDALTRLDPRTNIYLYFEFFSGFCNLKLVVRSLLEQYHFNGILYGSTHLQLKNWLTFSKDEPVFSFGFVILKDGKQVPAKTYREKNYVLRIIKISYVGIDNLIVLKIEDKDQHIKKLNQ